MFADFYNIRHQDLSIPQDYPPHPQAEVLVFAPIPVRYIKAIHFWDAAAQERWLPNNIGANYETSCTNRHYFEPRRDYKIWRPANFNNDGIPLSYIAENNVDDISLQSQETTAPEQITPPAPPENNPFIIDEIDLDMELDPNAPFVDPDDDEDDIRFDYITF